MSTLMKEPRIRKTAGPPPEEAARSLGVRLRALRKTQKVTLVELAKASRVDAATISRIETGRMSGTLQSHIRLATALGVKLTDLYAGIEEARVRGAVTLQAPAQHKDVYVHQAGKSSMAMLTADVMQKKLMPVLVTIEPDGSTHREEARVGTEAQKVSPSRTMYSSGLKVSSVGRGQRVAPALQAQKMSLTEGSKLRSKVWDSLSPGRNR